MKFDYSAPTPLAYFASLVQRDQGLPLLEAAASLGQDDYPALDVQQVLHDVDQLADRLRRRVAPDADPMERLRALGQFFFGDMGFAGNVNDYYNPDNSLVHVVLHTRRGIPISLAVLWLELAQGLGLHAEGVGFPGHFLVQVRLNEGRVVIDPFTGQSLDRADLRERVEDIHPDLSTLPRGDEALTPYLRAVDARTILARMLRNLQDIHRTQEEWRRFVRVQDRLVTLLPDAWTEYRDRGLALAELGDARRAADDLERYLHESTGASDRDLIAARLREVRGHAR